MREKMLIFVLLVTIIIPSWAYAQDLETYSDPNGLFSIQFDPSTWVAIPEANKFSPLLLSLGDRETEGDKVGVAISKLSPEDKVLPQTVDEGMQSSLLTLQNEEYNFELLEPIECQAYKIAGQKTCTFVYTSGFNKYEDIYKNIAFKTGDNFWLITFLVNGEIYDQWEAKLKTLIQTFSVGSQ